MNKTKFFLASVLLMTSTTWAQPDEYAEVEDSPTALSVLFNDSTDKPMETFVAAADPIAAVESKLVSDEAKDQKTNKASRKVSRGVASLDTAYDCAAVAAKIKKGEKLSKKDMSAYSKNCQKVD